MKSILNRPTLALALTAIMVANTPAAITIDSVPVGYIGNPSDATGYGSVGYGYAIGKYEVTLNQYCAFLNAVAKTDTYGLYNTQMGSYPQTMGIARGGVSGNYSYSVIGSGNRPVTYVSWFDSARFVNWLQNGQPAGLQAAGTTETGAYTLNGATSGLGFSRNANWLYGLPSEDEWYKAAYYDRSLNSGSGGYWLYPTRSNATPNSRNGSATDPNSANFWRDDGIANGYNGGYAVNNSTTWPTGNALTEVGAFSLAQSFYGTFDQGGNVREWNDAVVTLMGSGRCVRGGSWNSGGASVLGASERHGDDPANESAAAGFRIVIIPEPNLGVILFTGMFLIAWRWKRPLNRA